MDDTATASKSGDSGGESLTTDFLLIGLDFPSLSLDEGFVGEEPSFLSFFAFASEAATAAVGEADDLRRVGDAPAAAPVAEEAVFDTVPPADNAGFTALAALDVAALPLADLDGTAGGAFDNFELVFDGAFLAGLLPSLAPAAGGATAFLGDGVFFAGDVAPSVGDDAVVDGALDTGFLAGALTAVLDGEVAPPTAAGEAAADVFPAGDLTLALEGLALATGFFAAAAAAGEPAAPPAGEAARFGGILYYNVW